MKFNISSIRLSLFVFLGISAILLTSCIEEYWPELEGSYEDLLVVDGKITNEAGPYTIHLSKSSSLLNDAYNPLTGAIVIISDDEGNSETLFESSPGNYHTSIIGMQGVIGRKYKLSISTEGKTYESNYEELLAPIGIEAISYAEETKKVSETEEIYETGYQFYVTSELAPNPKNYFYWEVEETYEYHAPYTIDYIYNGSFDATGALLKYDEPYALYYCWTTANVDKIFTQNTEYLNEAKVKNLPLHFVQMGDEKLRIQYSMMAKQYAISEKAYTFKKSLEDMNSENSGLYAIQPYQIRGNVYNVDSPEEPVLGYFLTAGVANSEHVFTPTPVITKAEADKWSRETCFVVAPDPYNKFPTYREIIATSSPQDWPLYLSTVWAMVFGPSGSSYIPLTHVHDEFICIDCRTNGGTTQKPDFWIN